MEEDKRKRKLIHYTAYERVHVRYNFSFYKMIGILCKHALYELKKKKVMELPEHYILSPWTLSFRYRIGHTGVGTS